MDLPMGGDLYDSFMNYQKRVIEELDVLSRGYGFTTLDATQSEDDIADQLARHVTRQLRLDRRSAARPVLLK